MIKKLLFPLGSIGAIVAPLAAVISCGNPKSENIPSSNRTDDEIIHDLFQWTTKSTAISGLGAGAPIFKGLDEEVVKNHWNKAEGEGIRVAAITNAIGEGIWGLTTVPAADVVIGAISAGVKTSAQISTDIRLNEFKVSLIQNVEKFIKRNNLSSSLQKFDGFLTWFKDPQNSFENLKKVLLGGKIDTNFIMGVQRNLNDAANKTGSDQITVVPNDDTIQIPEADDSTSTDKNSGPNQTINQTAPKHPQTFATKNYTDTEVHKWIDDHITNVPYMLDWMKGVDGKFKQAATELTSATPKYDTIIELLLNNDGQDADNYMAGLMRTRIAQAAVGAIFGVLPEEANGGIQAAAIAATGDIGKAMGIKSNIGAMEQSHLNSINEYISFVNWISDPQEHYSNFRDVTGLDDDVIYKFQTEMQKLQTPVPTINIFD